MKKLLIIVPYPYGEAPSQRFRIEQYLDYLEEQGFQYKYAPFWDAHTWKRMYRKGGMFRKLFGLARGFFRRFRQLFSLHHYDVVYMHREAAPIGPPLFEWLIARVWKKKVVFDFDDAIWLPNNSVANELIVRKLKFHHKTEKIISWSWRISAGNQFLADYAKKFNDNVRIIPTTIDTENWHNKVKDYSKKNGEPLLIGWTGSHSTLKQLDQIYDVLEKMYFEHGTRFRVICDEPPQFKPHWVEFVQWKKETEIEDLLALDLGVMPLYNTEWEKGKCGFKAIQYHSLGIPSIISELEVSKNIIGTDRSLKENLAPSLKKGKWQERISHYERNPEMLRYDGDKLRKRIVNCFSVISQKEAQLNILNDG